MAYYSNKPSRGRGGYQRSYRTQTSNRRTIRKENIHPSRFVKAAQTKEAEVYEPKNSFADFRLHDLLHTNIQVKNYAAPSPIQDQAIPAALSGQDIVGIANTGTGKTLAFIAPVLHKLLNDSAGKALILAPTRELATQIEEEARALGKNSGIYGALLIGGTAMGPQLGDLRRDPRMVIGTPGRIKDHAERGNLNLSGFNIVVLDEVDRMLDMGFVNDMREILSRLQNPRQSFFFSATLDHKVSALIDSFSRSPVTISVKTSETSDNVEQAVINYNSNADKIEKLHTKLIDGTVDKTLIFNETQRSAEQLSKELQSRGFKAEAIHGGKSQSQRQRALDRFRANDINVLVATDVAARGIDVTDITHVINYATPRSYDDYVHRIGRAGRAGRMGYALTFIEN